MSGIVSKIKQMLPSRKWCIFISAVGAAASLISYDKYAVISTQSSINSRASVISKELVDPKDKIRKVRVYIHNTYWAKYWFKEYVRPVLDAAALDYDLFIPKEPGDIRKEIYDRLTRYRNRLDLPKTKTNPFGVRDITEDNYEPSEGLVAVGPNSWRELLRGISESMDKDPLDKKPSKNEGIELYPLGFINYSDLTGWRRFHIRIKNLFVSRNIAKTVGEDTLKVCFGNTKEFTEQSLRLGEDDIALPNENSERAQEEAKPVEVNSELMRKLVIYN